MSSLLVLPLLLAALTLSQAANLTLFAVAVGQGDCNIIQCPNGQDIIIVDMGAKDLQYASYQYVNKLLKDKFSAAASGKRIHMVVTHSHVDHYNYITRAMDSELVSNVQEIILGDTFSGYGSSFRNWLKDNLPHSTYSVNNGKKCFGNDDCKPTPVAGFGKKKARKFSGDPWQFCGSDVKITVLGANIGSSKNSRSVILRLVYKDWSLFMAGDFEMVTPQKELIQQYPNGQLRSTYYKVAHHGAWTPKKPNLPELLAQIQPKRVYMSQAYPNVSKFHHPNCQTIKNLQAIGSIDSINSALNYPFVCWDNGGVSRYSGLGQAIYETCRSYSSEGQVCQSVQVDSDGRYDSMRYVDVPPQYVVQREELAEVGDGVMEEWD